MLFCGIRGWWLALGLIASGAGATGCIGESPCEYTATCPPREGGLEDTTTSNGLGASSDTNDVGHAEQTEAAAPEPADMDRSDTDDGPKPIPTIVFPPVLPISPDLPPDGGSEDDEVEAGVTESDAEVSEPEMCCQTSSMGATCASECPSSCSALEPKQVTCGTSCINPMTDGEHCGASGDCVGENSGQVCIPPFACHMGTCVLECVGGHINCDDACINPSSNNTYCGASADCSENRGDVCAGNESCVSGVCRMLCPAAQVPCNGRCIDPATDETHCGASSYCEGDDVGVVCNDGDQCLSGSCRSPDGASCDVGVDCISGICATFFLDIDGDGYGAQSSGMQRVCGLQPPSAGYVTNNLDCCDNATDLTLAAEANPGFSGLPSRALSIPGCSRPFDWNCDGVETPSAPRGGCAQHQTQASCQGSFAGNPACGTVAEFHSCFWNTDANECVPGSIEGVMLLCY